MIGLVSGIITGLLSVGGGIILIFFLIMFPPLLMQTHFTMQTIAGFSIMQAFFATLSGSLYYLREKLINLPVVVSLGVPSFFGGMVGVVLAHSITDEALRWFFAVLAFLAALVMFIPYRHYENEEFQFSKLMYAVSIAFGIVIGIVGGMLGLSAGFLFVPLMVYLYRLNIKKAIGTSLIACLLLASGSFLMKLTTEAFSLQAGIALVIGGIIGAQLGGRLGKKMPPLLLKRITAITVLLISITVVVELF